MKGLLVGEDILVAEWAFTKHRMHKMLVDRAIGIVEDGKLIGAALFQNYNGNNVDFSYYGRNTLSVGLYRAIARVAVVEFNAARMTIMTSKKNVRLREFLHAVGFKMEGTMRCFYGPQDVPRNMAVRFVVFREKMEQVARLTPQSKKVLN